MSTLQAEHKTFNKKTVDYKTELSIIFVVYDTLKKITAFTEKENYTGLEYELADFLRPHAVSILYWNAI